MCACACACACACVRSHAFPAQSTRFHCRLWTVDGGLSTVYGQDRLDSEIFKNLTKIMKKLE